MRRGWGSEGGVAGGRVEGGGRFERGDGEWAGGGVGEGGGGVGGREKRCLPHHPASVSRTRVEARSRAQPTRIMR